MFKKAFESFFIIDANEKPAPSFLSAYLIAWFFVHKQVITTFISTTGAFDIRLHASIASITENLYMQAFGWAIAFVIIRFALNNLIYFFRESFDHLTQFTLNKLNMKSFIKTTVHQSVLDNLANARSKIHAFHDRATLAEESASQTKNELQVLKNETEVQHKDNLDALTEKKLEIDKIDKSNEVLTGQNNDLKVKLADSNDEHNKLIEEHNKLIEEHTVINNNYKSLVQDNKELAESYAESKNNLIIANKDNANLIGQVKIMDQSTSKLLEQKGELISSLDLSNSFKENINKQITKWANNTKQPELMLLGRNESDLKIKEKILLDKVLNSFVFDNEPSKKSKQLLKDIGGISQFGHPNTPSEQLLKDIGKTNQFGLRNEQERNKSEKLIDLVNKNNSTKDSK
jgi:hypothetical protein